mmetsp:Transcript_13947/g.23195  ORF Transcript_13947/g.23195 Transcript_13947/m.23195 type:complete len:169 (+) Transcript_13947:406-912(+)
MDAPIGNRVKLLAVPFSKTTHFGVEDVNELASMIAEDCGDSFSSSTSSAMDMGDDAVSQRTDKAYLMLKNDQVTPSLSSSSSSSSSSMSKETKENVPSYRLPKLVALYASRACRSAIMIGTALKLSEMARIVTKLEHVEQPWNCPHGRPTMRHLVDIETIRIQKQTEL